MSNDSDEEQTYQDNFKYKNYALYKVLPEVTIRAYAKKRRFFLNISQDFLLFESVKAKGSFVINELL